MSSLDGGSKSENYAIVDSIKDGGCVDYGVLGSPQENKPKLISNGVARAFTIRRFAKKTLTNQRLKNVRISNDAAVKLADKLSELALDVLACVDLEDRNTLLDRDIEPAFRRWLAKRFLIEYRPLMESLRQSTDYLATQLELIDFEVGKEGDKHG